MRRTGNRTIGNIATLALVLTAGCGAADTAARSAGDCQDAERHLEKCGLIFDDANICSENEKDMPIHRVLSLQQATCIGNRDCGELRAQAEGGSVCGADVKNRYK